MVVFVISFGVYFTIVFITLIYYFVISISLGSSLDVKVSVIIYLILASTNNALATAGPDLTIVTALAFIARGRPIRVSPDGSTGRHRAQPRRRDEERACAG